MITAAQIRAGRGLLKWTQGVLASRASLSVVTLNMIESDQVNPRSRTLEAIRGVLEGEGIRFIGDEREGYGVLLKPTRGEHGLSGKRIDLNADLGEGFGDWRIGDDERLLDVVTSANLACGFHAGDPDIMVETARAARARGVAIGAHPGFQDLRGFGRRVIRQSPTTIERDVAYQVGALQACAALAGHRVAYVKAHGALANLANADDAVAAAIARAVAGVDRSLPLVVMPGLPAERAAERAGLTPIREIYADRAYAEDGSLAPRSAEGAVLHDPEAIAARVRRMVEEGAVTTVTGRAIPLGIDTVCVHGDNPAALAAAAAVRRELEAAGLVLAPFAAPV